MPQQRQLHVNGVEICVFEWGTPQPGKPPLLFVHANSFHARIWDQVIVHLPEFHCVALDLRGHGRSSKPAPPHDWNVFAQDLIAVARELGISGAVGIGHSLGGHTVTLAAALQPALFGALLLLDPVILTRQSYVGANEIGQFAARRRNVWHSPEEMIERFRDRPPFHTWQEAVLHDYARYGLLPNSEGSFNLACPPEFEAAIYNLSTAADIYPEITRVQVPVTVMRAAEPQDGNLLNFSASPTAPDLAAQFARGYDLHMPNNSHFIPMEAPDQVAETVRRIALAL